MENGLKSDLTAKLKYLGLDMDKIPDSLLVNHALNFNYSRLNNDKDHKVFRFVPIEKIEILLTPTLRSDSVREKYSKAFPLIKYLEADSSTEEGIERYTTLLRMISTFSIAEVENISNIQKEMKDHAPFRVRYNKEHLWQIYYSEETDRYFMLVCTKESTFAEFFYLLKMKIEMATKKIKETPMIFIPINYMNYSETFLNRDEIVDLENYLWLFTKNWPVVYEVYDKQNRMSLQIIGETFVYEAIRSTYKIELISKQEAIKFYKQIKAIFIMQTEIKGYFEFSTKINSKNELELYFENQKITYENITEFVKKRYEIAVEEIKKQNELSRTLERKLTELKEECNSKETEYIQKQREIGAFLECKKTFMGRVKYFFKSNKMNKKIQRDVEKERFTETEELYTEKLEVRTTIDTKPFDTYMKDKRYFTIEDLVVVYSMLDNGKKKYQDLGQDTKAMELKYINLNTKVENAKTYIAEIDKHKKSIFDFWKFTTKDEILSLETGTPNEQTENNNIKRVFDFESDFEALGVEMDKLQKRKLSKEETDSIFAVNSNIIDVINTLRRGEMDEKQIKSSLKKLKEEFNKDRLYIREENFDIFGNITDDSRKSKYIGSRSHRENEKSKYKILNINKDIDEFDFTEKLQTISNFVEGAIPKVQAKFNMPLYKLVEIPNVLDKKALMVCNINVENELKNYEDKGEGALNLLKINFKEEMPLLYYTNIIYYDNTNQTLPEGMDLSTEVLIDCNRFKFKLINKDKFRTNNYFRESNNLILPKFKDIFVYEYDVELK